MCERGGVASGAIRFILLRRVSNKFEIAASGCTFREKLTSSQEIVAYQKVYISSSSHLATLGNTYWKRASIARRTHASICEKFP